MQVRTLLGVPFCNAQKYLWPRLLPSEYLWLHQNHFRTEIAPDAGIKAPANILHSTVSDIHTQIFGRALSIANRPE